MAQEFRDLVRVHNADIQGNKKIINGLRNVSGVSFMFANMVCELAKIDKHKKAGELTDDEINKLEAVISDPVKAGAPVWMLNRRKDLDTGNDIHITTNDLSFIKDNDLKLLKKIKCYKGIRHMRNLPVRGQRTKSNFRKNKGKATGVKKRAGAKTGRS
ncbi:30S ribosomal protein S13 [Candidatus Woesearchaeota archaeon]|nr:30S ribosomal protein S13 [Candidatus Woesearchaeota archaeon]